MRNALLIVVFSLFLMGTLRGAGDITAPDWSLLAADGETVRLSEVVEEQPVLLFFWATWCPYCKALMPHLQSMRLEYDEQLRILAVNFRENGDPVAFIADAGYDFTVLPDGDEIAAAYDVYATPGIVIVDQDMMIRFDLRSLPQRDPPPTDHPASHRRKAAYRAPYWAAAIRKSIDAVIRKAGK
ncbi:MAG: TlpA family protein disulfide reductase [Gammaproteobacteria bacterium]|nr:TlpA family protein disulfide reductase [Gammaproteobacteria bacterium]